MTSATEHATGLDLVVSEAGSILAPLVALAADCDVRITRVDVHEPDLESVFLHLTGRALRD